MPPPVRWPRTASTTGSRSSSSRSLASDLGRRRGPPAPPCTRSLWDAVGYQMPDAEPTYIHLLHKHGLFPFLTPEEPGAYDRVWILKRIQRSTIRSWGGRTLPCWRIECIDPALAARPGRGRRLDERGRARLRHPALGARRPHLRVRLVESRTREPRPDAARLHAPAAADAGPRADRRPRARRDGRRPRPRLPRPAARPAPDAPCPLRLAEPPPLRPARPVRRGGRHGRPPATPRGSSCGPRASSCARWSGPDKIAGLVDPGTPPTRAASLPISSARAAARRWPWTGGGGRGGAAGLPPTRDSTYVFPLNGFGMTSRPSACCATSRPTLVGWNGQTRRGYAVGSTATTPGRGPVAWSTCRRTRPCSGR